MKKNKLIPLQQQRDVVVELNKLDPTPPILPIQQRYGISWNGNSNDKNIQQQRNTTNSFFDVLRPRRDLVAVESPEQVKHKQHPVVEARYDSENQTRFQLSALQLTLTGTNNKKTSPPTEVIKQQQNNQHQTTKLLQDSPMKLGNSVIVGSKLTSWNHHQSDFSSSEAKLSRGEDGTRNKKESNDMMGGKKVKLKSRSSKSSILMDGELKDGISVVMTTLQDRRDKFESQHFRQ